MNFEKYTIIPGFRKSGHIWCEYFLQICNIFTWICVSCTVAVLTNHSSWTSAKCITFLKALFPYQDVIQNKEIKFCKNL